MENSNDRPAQSLGVHWNMIVRQAANCTWASLWTDTTVCGLSFEFEGASQMEHKTERLWKTRCKFLTDCGCMDLVRFCTQGLSQSQENGVRTKHHLRWPETSKKMQQKMWTLVDEKDRSNCVRAYASALYFAYGSKTVLIKHTFLLMGRGGYVGVGWGGAVGMFTFCLVRTVHISTLPRSLECLPRYMLLRCRDLWNACHVTCCYAAEISGMLAMLHVATLPRSLECLPRCMLYTTLPRSLEDLPRYMLLRCRDLWNACHVTCCYAAEISGMIATLHVATLPRSLECLPCYMLLRCRDLWNACHVTCCYAAEISGMLTMLHVATLPRSLECLPRYMLLRCRDLWNACRVACYILRCRDLWNACHVACYSEGTFSYT